MEPSDVSSRCEDCSLGRVEFKNMLCCTMTSMMDVTYHVVKSPDWKTQILENDKIHYLIATLVALNAIVYASKKY